MLREFGMKLMAFKSETLKYEHPVSLGSSIIKVLGAIHQNEKMFLSNSKKASFRKLLTNSPLKQYNRAIQSSLSMCKLAEAPINFFEYYRTSRSVLDQDVVLVIACTSGLSSVLICGVCVGRAYRSAVGSYLKH